MPASISDSSSILPVSFLLWLSSFSDCLLPPLTVLFLWLSPSSDCPFARLTVSFLFTVSFLWLSLSSSDCLLPLYCLLPLTVSFLFTVSFDCLSSVSFLFPVSFLLSCLLPPLLSPSSSTVSFLWLSLSSWLTFSFCPLPPYIASPSHSLTTSFSCIALTPECVVTPLGCNSFNLYHLGLHFTVLLPTTTLAWYIIC